MKRLLAAAICLIMLLPGIARAETQPAADAPADAAYLIEANSGRVLYTKNENAHLPMASTTKIMTALLAIESGRMDETVTVPDEAVGTEGSSMYLKKGETLRFSDLVYGLMLTSGNDAAVAIACLLDGSTAAFADRMNARAEALGLNDTHFVTPNGLHDPNHYTSARDLAMLSAKALEDPTFAKIVSTQYHRTEGSNPRTLKNKNRLLWEYEGGVGVKTGYTKKAGKCLVFAAEYRKEHAGRGLSHVSRKAVFKRGYGFFAVCEKRRKKIVVCSADSRYTVSDGDRRRRALHRGNVV